MSFSEIVVIILVGLVVFGPKELPKMAKSTAQLLRKLVRWAYELRAQSGIDDVIKAEGLEEVRKDLADIRKITRGELDGIVAATRTNLDVDGPLSPYSETDAPRTVDREREQPIGGPDDYGALPETAGEYAEALPPSPLAEDPHYMRGEPRPTPPAEGPL